MMSLPKKNYQFGKLCISYLTGKKSWNGNAQLQVHVNFNKLGIPNPTWSNRPDHSRPWKNQLSKHRQDTKSFKRFGATTLKGRVLCSCFLKGICSTWNALHHIFFARNIKYGRLFCDCSNHQRYSLNTLRVVEETPKEKRTVSFQTIMSLVDVVTYHITMLKYKHTFSSKLFNSDKICQNTQKRMNQIT